MAVGTLVRTQVDTLDQLLLTQADGDPTGRAVVYHAAVVKRVPWTVGGAGRALFTGCAATAAKRRRIAAS